MVNPKRGGHLRLDKGTTGDAPIMGLRVNREIYDYLKQRSEKEGRNMSELIREILLKEVRK